MTEEALDGIELRSVAGFRPSPGEGLALVAEVRRLHAEVYRWRDAAAVNLRLAQGQSEKLDRARELVAASCHTDDCAASHHQHCGAECDYDDSTPEECARTFREDCECGLRGLCDALGVEVDRG
jgi:hypothetical protein